MAEKVVWNEEYGHMAKYAPTNLPEAPLGPGPFLVEAEQTMPGAGTPGYLLRDEQAPDGPVIGPLAACMFQAVPE